MPVVIDATPGSSTANSFVSLTEANALMETQLFSDNDWDNADNDQKNRALVTATRLIVAEIMNMWLGWPTSLSQALPFPRSGVLTLLGSAYYPDGVIPTELKMATTEYARQLINLGEMPDTPLDAAGLKSFSAGPVSITFDEKYQPPTTGMPESVRMLIRHLYNSRSSINVPAYRT